MEKELFNELIEYIKRNKGKFLGGFLGFIIGVFVLIIGFFKTIFIVFCTCIGFIIGSKSYGIEDMKRIIKKLFSPTNRI
ncbi:DUF2273 domain-containing protein [Schnuerera sp.]|uniref:DUF2273 domain-containing protein n=1 Tax=Schnuerera sp. TaxID=2794844 RepID=UPI002C29537F|nr:DUF2273 domain-containing protein [Schnuerera sp.]HSH36913.1 DUF2273 domain-containing protein [Schnuerera sp.]